MKWGWMEFDQDFAIKIPLTKYWLKGRWAAGFILLLALFMGCAPILHNHKTGETPLDDICSPDSEFISCYNSCRANSQNRDEMDLCPRNCHRRVCLDSPWLY